MRLHRNSRTAIAIAYLFLRGTAVSAQELKLIPQPRQVEQSEGALRIAPGARIVLNTAHAREDRVAADILVEEIRAATGRKLTIVVARPAETLAGAIYLARLGDDRRLRAALASKGLAVEDDFNPEGYVLDADRRGIRVAGMSGAGLFYGVQTLRQLLRPSRDRRMECPAVRIKDWPAMRRRGVQDDISRGPVPTLDYMKQQIHTIAEYKLNLYSLYMEHVFDYESQPIVALKEGALTAAEVRELVEYAKKYFVTILPEQQAFGHLHHLLKYELYNDLAETPHGHVLTPVNEKTYELIGSTTCWSATTSWPACFRRRLKTRARCRRSTARERRCPSRKEWVSSTSRSPDPQTGLRRETARSLVRESGPLAFTPAEARFSR